jgi:hypothetical protein
MQGRTKKILIGILIVVIAGAITGYILWNKTSFSVANAKPVAQLTAAGLLQSFISDSSGAKKNYIGDENNEKVIQVTGEVAEYKTNQENQAVVMIRTGTDGSFVNCTFEGKISDKDMPVGKTISLKGICNGYNFDADMGIPGDIILVRCYLIK